MQYTAVLALLAAVASASPISTRATYKSYHGNGTPSAGWPAESSWASFDTIWSGYQTIIGESCSAFSQPNTSPSEAAEMKTAIQSVAKSTGVDERFILATILQESKGCVRVWQTGNGVNNPGLMQDHNGAGKCNTAVAANGVVVTPGTAQNPCPQSEITQMIQDGAGGTSGGDGLKQTLAKAPGGASTAQGVYGAARIYNSGSIAASGDLSNANGATASYSSDIANRLMGVVFDNSQFA